MLLNTPSGIIRTNIFLLYLFLFVFASCNKGAVTGKTSFGDDWDAVASVTIENNDTIIVCDLSKVTKHKILPISLFVDSISYIILENGDDALISKRLSNVYTTSNYIGVTAGGYFPFKLFRKNGAFICNIGTIGQGVGEYVAIDAAYMDEENDRIYILPYSSDKILVYNFNAKYLFDIKLIERTMYGSSIRIDTKKESVLVTNSIVGTPNYFVWIQDFNGNLKQGAKSADYFKNLSESYDESTLTRFRTDNVELFRFGYKNTNEYLYHYDIVSNRLIPQFKVINADENLSIMIHELPFYYVIEEACSVAPDQDELETRKIIVDKKTLKGCIVDGFQLLDDLVYNDYCLFTQMHGAEFAILDMSSIIERRIKKIDKKTTNILFLEKEISYQKKDQEDECSVVFIGKFKR